MTDRSRRKTISVLLVLCLIAAVFYSTAVFSYAETGADAAEYDAGSAENTAEAQEQKQYKIVRPRPITNAEIKKYNKYKGKNAKKIPVITYHRILADSVKNSPKYANDRYSTSLSKFKQQMKWLKKKKYRTISCDELYLWHEGKIRLPKRSVLITIDDGHGDSVENFVKVLSKYHFKGTAFIIGQSSCEPDWRTAITEARIKKLRKNNKYIEFQSHTYGLHRNDAYRTEDYDSFMADAGKQREIFGFEYVAYPHGYYSSDMIKAYKHSGIRMAFCFDKTGKGYVTKKQNLYKLKRIEIRSTTSLKKFKKWCP